MKVKDLIEHLKAFLFGHKTHIKISSDRLKITPPIIYITYTDPQIGKGVFAAQTFHKGDIVEICPVVIISGPFDELPPTLKKRIFNWHHLTKGADGPHGLALGYGSLYNHSDDPNLYYEAVDSESCLYFKAKRKIKPDEQLTINYDHAYGNKGPVKNSWFEKNKIEKMDI